MYAFFPSHTGHLFKILKYSRLVMSIVHKIWVNREQLYWNSPKNLFCYKYMSTQKYYNNQFKKKKTKKDDKIKN